MRGASGMFGGKNQHAAAWGAVLVCAFLCVGAAAGREADILEDSPKVEVEKFGIIIGVSHYDDEGIDSLCCAAEDAAALYEVLTSVPQGFEQSNLALICDGQDPGHQPTRSNILKYLRSYISLAGENDTILIFFSGHGMLADDSKLYLAPRDAAKVMLEETCVSFDDLRAMLDSSRAKRKVILLDACHSGAGKSIEALTADAIEELEEISEGTFMLTSCAPQERSFEMKDKGHGAFTFFLLEGLRGNADANADNLITMSEVSNYVSHRTRRWAANQGQQQTPRIKVDIQGEIILARTKDDNAVAPPVPPEETATPAVAAAPDKPQSPGAGPAASPADAAAAWADVMSSPTTEEAVAAQEAETREAETAEDWAQVMQLK